MPKTKKLKEDEGIPVNNMGAGGIEGAGGPGPYAEPGVDLKQHKKKLKLLKDILKRK